MKITKDYEGLVRIQNGDYVLEGDLISEDTIEVELDDHLVVRGTISSKKSIFANRTIIAGEGIEAGCGIKAGDGIKAGWGIEAGEGIKAGWGIEAGCRIFAGLSIFQDSNNCIKNITCAELLGGEICYGDLIIIK